MKKIIKNTLEKIVNFIDRQKKNILIGVTALVLNAGVANADYTLRVTSYSLPLINNNEITLKHKTGATEYFEGTMDRIYLQPPTDKKIHFYSKNDLTIPITDGRLMTDVRPVDSLSTFTNYFEGEGLDESEIINNELYFNNYSTLEPNNNVLVTFYNNTATLGDPNWVYSGVTLDAQEAGKTPEVSPVTVPVKNGLSNIMQVSYFPVEDVDFSGDVNFNDFAKVAAYWNVTFDSNSYPRTANSPTTHPEVYADIDNDGYVGMTDLDRLVGAWLWQKPPYCIDVYDPINPDPNACE